MGTEGLRAEDRVDPGRGEDSRDPCSEGQRRNGGRQTPARAICCQTLKTRTDSDGCQSAGPGLSMRVLVLAHHSVRDWSSLGMLLSQLLLLLGLLVLLLW